MITLLPTSYHDFYCVVAVCSWSILRVTYDKLTREVDVNSRESEDAVVGG